ncbi:4-hydroxy-2-oxoheptanedioate aldolase [Constrictibacter sp. MBR-5]|uniref:HpcH/HpaI aldolase family protein n=1 Tax=Constrictibacter sp. MBR-5 TaxID=3156467 RepID=UPI0033968D8F
MMRENKVKTIWKSGGAVVNGWLAIPSSVSAEAMAHCGFDSLTIDVQHGLIDYSSALPMLQAISTREATPLARVPWLEPGIIMKMLDAGTYGIICPMINTRAEAEKLVGACKYAPIGYRSFAGARNSLYGGPGFSPKAANETVLAIAMIETVEAMQNLDAIMSTPGLDGIYVGPSDLGLSMGREAKLDQTDPVVVEALDRILASAKQHGVHAGLHCGSPAYAAQMIKKGFQLVSLSSEMGMMQAAATAAAKSVRHDAGLEAPKEAAPLSGSRPAY